MREDGSASIVSTLSDLTGISRVCREVIPMPYPLTALAQVRQVMEASRWGMFINLFQVSQQASTMPS